MPTRLKDPDKGEGKRAAYIGQWFRNRRLQIKRSLQQCADLSGCAISTHSELERGHYDPLRLSIKFIPALSRAYNVRPESILWRFGIIDPPETSEWKHIKKLMEEDD
jgi:transcriptional regulator with XRE-family HTH domain